jgi:WhiB family redox-sensing transcriptional regulator
MFFHPENERGPSRTRREDAAKKICSGCPVTRECLDWALRTREPYGVWGGKSTEERTQLIKLRTAV